MIKDSVGTSPAVHKAHFYQKFGPKKDASHPIDNRGNEGSLNKGKQEGTDLS